MEEILNKIFEKKSKLTEVRIQKTYIDTIILKDGRIEEIKHDESFGASIRVINKRISFASTNNLNKLYDIFEKIYKNSSYGFEEIEVNCDEVHEDSKEVEQRIRFEDIELEERVKFLQEIFKKTKDYEGIFGTTIILSNATVEKWYYNSIGSKIFQKLHYISLYASCYARRNDRLQYAFDRIGGTGGFELVMNFNIKNVCEKALRLLKAKKPKAGRYKVILDPKLAGVFIHEALGHAVEADHIIRGESILINRLGEKIASDILNVYDDSTLKNSYGFYFYDDEGVKARKKVLIENGILKNYLTSRETSKVLNLNLTGNARAQNYSYIPLVRMSNTYIGRGDYKFEEMLEDIKYGYYLKGSKGGEVDTVRGVFQFSAEEGFLIENGEIKHPITDISMSGEILETLKTIDAIGKDLDFHIGNCGKESQLVPVSDGSPHIRCITTIGGI